MARRAIAGMPRFTSLSCDQIQIPRPGLFLSADLIWYSDEAYIPIERLEDFINGEEDNPLTRCRFIKKKIVERTTHGSITTVYQCHFGPKDLRNNVTETAPSQRTTTDGKRPVARSTELGMSLKRGCQCRFSVVLYTDRPQAVMIRWIKKFHRDSNGAVCHGLIDPGAIFSNSHLPHSISRALREFVERLLLSQVDPINIIATHNRMVKEEIRTDDFSDAPTLWSRDMQLQYQDVLNVQAAMKAKKGYYSRKDHINISMWVEANPHLVIHYEPGSEAPYKPFSLVWASPWQVKILATLGQHNAVAMDATFGTNEYKFQLFTLITFDSFQNGIPCVWAVLERHKAEDLITMLSLVKQRVEDLREDPRLNLEREWKPSCFVIDVAAEESQALRTVWPNCRILLCLYHVRRAWRVQLHAKVKSAENKAEIHRQLGDIMYGHSGQGPMTASQQFILRWQDDEPQFVAYYTSHWHGKLDRWVKSYRTFPHANQNTNGSIERYHRTLKNELRVDRKMKLGRKVSWLVEKLANDLEHWYWMRSGQKSQGRVRNTIAESQVMAAIDKARHIPDAAVTFSDVWGRKLGKVQSCTNPLLIHCVIDFETDDSHCTCTQGQEGNTCKHQIKCLLMSGHHEVDLLHRLGTKKGSICGGLEYAASLADGNGVGPNSQVTDISYARDSQPANVEIEGPDPMEESEEGNVRSPTMDEETPITREDFLPFVDEAFNLYGQKPYILKHAVKGMSNLMSKLRVMDARTDPSNPADMRAHMAPTAQPLRAVPGSSRSLRPLTSFIDTIGKRKQRRRRVVNPYSGSNAPLPLRKKVAQKKTFQQVLDTEARAEALAAADAAREEAEAAANAARVEDEAGSNAASNLPREDSVGPLP